MAASHPPGRVATARALRREGLSIREVAARIGVARSTVGDWLKGEGEPLYVKTCWCGERFVARHGKARSCSQAHAYKRYKIFGRADYGQ
jgi:transcriptional regulator with XRE-family HTH domain